ncbi:MAG: pyridoxal kinase [Treponema sp.]|jgi:pyridoxine kinase|nr:pyridoxal kinase [Treponema sp.]
MAVLSIQSHVAYGHAGNSAAVFPLQRLGREVWAVHTVEFSNHTGYKAWRGKVLGASLVKEIVLGLEERGILENCEAVLSGYLGDASIGRAILGAVKRVRSAAPNALYCCDPVMGDVGRGFYVSPDIPDMFRREVVPLADIITPNQFELEALTGIKTADLDGAVKAIEALHKAGPKVVLVTSYRRGQVSGALDGSEDSSAAETTDPAGDKTAVKKGTPVSAGTQSNEIEMLVSNGREIYSVRTPELYFEGLSMMAGSGDLTTAVFLSRYLETGDICRTLELTASSVYGIIEATHAAQSREIVIVAAQEELVHPSRNFTAEKL